MNNYEIGGVSKSIVGLGKGLGVGAALLAAPAVYVRTRAACMAYYADAVGSGLAKWMTWATGLLEAYLVYAMVSLAFVGLVTWWIAKRAAASFGG
jgi:hypothetical protein